MHAIWKGTISFGLVSIPIALFTATRREEPPAKMKRCHWVEPKLVCQVKFSEWTRDGKLRQPVFLGLRDDKDAGEVVREQPR
jgi:ATP-dependent DNA ligase